MKLVTEFIGESNDGDLHELAVKANIKKVMLEQKVRGEAEATSAYIEQAFAEPLTKEESETLVKAIRGDFGILTKYGYSMSDIREFLLDNGRDQEIANVQTNIENIVNASTTLDAAEKQRLINYYLESAHALGYDLIEKKATVAGLNINANNIA